jgi:hypothetical protein
VLRITGDGQIKIAGPPAQKQIPHCAADQIHLAGEFLPHGCQLFQQVGGEQGRHRGGGEGVFVFFFHDAPLYQKNEF